MALLAVSPLVLASAAEAQKGGGAGGRPAQVQEQAAQVTVANRSGTRIDVINVSPVTSDNWGRDFLGDGTLASGRRITFRIQDGQGCNYDLRVIYQDGRQEERRNVDLCAVMEVSFTGQNARMVDRNQGGQQGGQQQQRPGGGQGQQQGDPDFILVNASRMRIGVLNVSPVADQNWGADRLGGALSPGGRFTVRLGAPGQCMWDIRVVYEDAREEEKRNVNLCNVNELAFDGSQARGQQAQQPPQGQPGQQQAQQPQRPPPGTLMSTGTGFYISRQGHVLTNRHVIEGCGTVAIARPNGSRVPLRVVAEDAVNDLAVLQLQGTVSPALTFRTVAQPVRAGDKVVVLGYPVRQLLGELNVTEGAVSAVRGPRGDGTLFQITAPVQGGNSGGPILDENGLVVGVVVARFENLPGGRPAQNINFGIQLDVTRRFVQSLGLSLQEGQPGEARRTSDIAERAQPAVLPLDCLS
jgi:S1-C subfamily serine protease